MVADAERPSSDGAGQSQETRESGKIPDDTQSQTGATPQGRGELEGGRMKMRLINKTKIPNELIRAIIRFVRPAGIKGFKVQVSNTKGHYHGRGGRGRIRVWFNTKQKFPRILTTYQYGQLKARYTKPDPATGARRQRKGRRYYLASLTECLIYVIAHELVHVRQGQKGALRGRVWGARGRFSEIETESYAIRKLRDYRQNS